MGSKLKHFLAIGVLFFVLSGCASLGQPTAKPMLQSTSQPSAPPSTLTPAPAATETVTPNPATSETNPPITGLQMIDENKGWAWINAQRLLRTTDGGVTWSNRSPEGQIQFDGAFFLDAQTAWVPIYLKDSNRNGLLHTLDGGQTWSQYPSGPASGLHMLDALKGWAQEAAFGAGNAYYTLSETRDGGKTWTPIPVTQPQPETGLPPGTVHLCNMCSDSFYYDPGRMIIVYGDMASMQSGGSVRMQVSFDLGKTWQSRNLPLPKADYGALVSSDRLSFFENSYGILPVHLIKTNSDGSYPYASQRLAFYNTQDGGASWSLLPGVLDNVAPYAPMQIVSSKDIFVLCGNALCVSHDGAQTWQPLTSNLDFTQTDQRALLRLDFLNAMTGWALLTENDANTLYQTSDGGNSWNKITPRIVASPAVTSRIDTSIPTPTLIPTPTTEPTATPDISFDPQANAYRIRFAPNATWVEINDSIAAKATKRYVLSAIKGQIMGVSIPEVSALTVSVTGADQKALSDSRAQHPFWRGELPSTQDYIITVASQAAAPFTLRVAINPPGQATQNFGFYDMYSSAALGYTDEFAPSHANVPIVKKGIPVLTLAFIDPSYYSPTTNLSEAYLILSIITANQDPTIASICTQPLTNPAEVVTGQVTINDYTFTRTEFNGVAAGNLYDQISYRTAYNSNCFEVTFLFHSGNIGNYSPGTVVEFDRAALLKKFEVVLNTFMAK